MIDTEIHLTPEELQRRLRLKNVRTLANWRVKGKGPKFTKVGARVLYPLVEVEWWELANTKGSTAG